MRRSLACLALACLAAGIMLATTAPAMAAGEQSRGPQRVAVVRLTFEGTVPEAARKLFSDRIVQGLTAADFEVLAGKPVESKLATTPDLAACKTPSCFGEVARALNVGYLVAGRLEARDKNYEISLELINGRTGAALGTNRESCVICGIEEAAEKIELAATALRGRLEVVVRQPARFIVRSRPAGAIAIIDGKQVGKTPLDIELPGGPHNLKLQAAGYDPVDHAFSATSGVDETIDMELLPLPTRFPYRTAGYAALAVGVAALIAGIWATAVDGEPRSCSKNQQDSEGDCPSLWDTRKALPLLLAGGGALTAVGGMWLWIARTGKGQPGLDGPASSTSTADAAGVVMGVSGRF